MLRTNEQKLRKTATTVILRFRLFCFVSQMLRLEKAVNMVTKKNTTR